MNTTLTPCEWRAVADLAEFEVVKLAACKRCVSEHTLKNQLRSAMAKLGVTTQIGLMKAFYRLVYGVEFNIREARRIGAACLLVLFVYSIGSTDSFPRPLTRVRRNEIEISLMDC